VGGVLLKKTKNRTTAGSEQGKRKRKQQLTRRGEKQELL
jgi:hypothetical protein